MASKKNPKVDVQIKPGQSFSIPREAAIAAGKAAVKKKPGKRK